MLGNVRRLRRLGSSIATPRLTFVVHSAEQTVAALTAAAKLGIPIYLRSAEAAGMALGAPWFAAMIAIATAEAPATDAIAVLDCGTHAGAALAAFRHGVTHVRIIVAPPVKDKLANIAEQSGCHLVKDDAFQPVIDLDEAPDALAEACYAAKAPQTAAK